MPAKFYSVIFLCFLFMNVKAQPGKIDSSFGNNGFADIDIHNGSYDIFKTLAVQPDGKIICIGSYNDTINNGYSAEHSYLMRFKQNGSRDSSFGVNGFVQVLMSVAYVNTEVTGLKIQPDGKILICGHGYVHLIPESDFVVMRYNPNGTLDAGFGNNGVAITDITGEGGEDIPYGIGVQPDGKIIVAGENTSDTYSGFVVARYTQNGLLDATFGTNGVSHFPVHNFNLSYIVYQASLQVDANGKIYAAGSYNSFHTTYPTGSFLLKYTPGGAPDSSFGNNGLVNIPTGNNSGKNVNALYVLPDEKILIGTHAYTSSTFQNEIIVTKYNANGTIDNNFGNNGSYRSAITSQYSAFSLWDIIVQQDGKTILGGYTNIEGIYKMTLSRLTADGSLDKSFGKNGIVKLPNQYSASGGNAVQLAIDNNNKLIAGCDISNDNNLNMLLSRFFLENNDGLISNANKISLQKQRNNLSIFPNPVTNKISVSGISFAENTLFSVSDNKGNIVLRGTLNKSMQINTGNLTAGIYYLHLENINCNKTIKFIKQ
jgi:uncharacterized delta-60 repeat protein